MSRGLTFPLNSCWGKAPFLLSFKFKYLRAFKQIATTKSVSSSTSGSTSIGNTESHHPHHHYTLKCLKAKTITEPDDLVFNAVDLQIEAQILSRVRHPHIIALRGLSRYRLGDSYAMADGYFVLLEIMETKLLDKLSESRRQKIQVQEQRRRAR